MFEGFTATTVRTGQAAVLVRHGGHGPPPAPTLAGERAETGGGTSGAPWSPRRWRRLREAVVAAVARIAEDGGAASPH